VTDVVGEWEEGRKGGKEERRKGGKEVRRWTGVKGYK
jgi:hypothetical protein